MNDAAVMIMAYSGDTPDLRCLGCGAVFMVFDWQLPPPYGSVARGELIARLQAHRCETELPGGLTAGQLDVLRSLADGLRRYPGDGHTSAGLIEIMNELADCGLVARNGEHNDEYTITRAGAELAREEGP